MPIIYDVHDRVALVTIDRPEARNALDDEHNTALADAFDRADADATIRAVVLTGARGVAFSAGADLRTMLPSFRKAVLAGEEPPWVIGGLTAEEPRDKPVVAAVNGHALAGGLEMALGCDVRIASVNATFGLAETKWAMIPGAGGTQRLPRAVPHGIAMEMILTGDPIDAEHALRWGLISRITTHEDLVPTALRLASSIAARGPLAVAAARRAVREGLTLGLEPGLGVERQLFYDVIRTRDAAEGPRAFAEKRVPVYEGR